MISIDKKDIPENHYIEIIPGYDDDDSCAELRHKGPQGSTVVSRLFISESSGCVGVHRGGDMLWFLPTRKEIVTEQPHEAVHHPRHYNSHPEGIEAYYLTKHENFLCGNVFKYLLRHGLKNEDIVEDIDKALEYLQEYKAYVEEHGEKALPQWRLDVRKESK